MRLPKHKNNRNVAMLVLLPVLALAGGCSTDSGARTTSKADPVDEGEYLTAADVRKDPDRIICRRHKPTGSRISEKICMTAKQWQLSSDAGQDMLDRAQRAPKSYND